MGQDAGRDADFFRAFFLPEADLAAFLARVRPGPRAFLASISLMASSSVMASGSIDFGMVARMLPSST